MGKLRRGAGLEDMGPEDTFDGDYGRLLERAYVKGGRSRRSIRRLRLARFWCLLVVSRSTLPCLSVFEVAT